MDTSNKAPTTEPDREHRFASVGNELARRMASVLDAVPDSPQGPAELARRIGVDKVLASRVLRATRTKDPLAVLYLAPGPEPLRRLLRAARKGAVPPELVASAEDAVRQFETLIRREAGDRSGLDAIISAWLPEARSEFELRRKQAAYRAMSQLKGAAMETHLSSMMLHLSEDGVNLDVVCLVGFMNLHRLRPGAAVKFSTRRQPDGEAPRHPLTIDGTPVDGTDGLRLEEFCSTPPARLHAQHAGNVVHYTLAGDDFGPQAASDLVFAEVNPADMPHRLPGNPDRKRLLAADVTIPAKTLVFDALLHESVFPGIDPNLVIYDTSFDGIADVNDPARDIDRYDLCETIRPLGRGIREFRTTEIPQYTELLRHVCTKLNWNGEKFRGYRCRIEYPIYGSQITMAFDPPP